MNTHDYETPAEDSGHHHVPTHFTPSTTRRVVMFAIVLILGLGAIFVFRFFIQRNAEIALNAELEKNAAQPLIVDVVHARPCSQSKELKLPGDARAYFDTTIFARTSGYLADVKVDIGDTVEAGNVLATIETPDLDDQLVAANAKLDELKAQVGVAETSRDFAKISFKRWDESTSDGSVSKQDRDQKKSEWDAAEAKLKPAEAQVALGNAEIKRLQTLQTFKEVRAPFAGVITDRHVDPGELVTAGSTTNTSPLFSLMSVDKIRVLVDVPQNSAPDVKQKMAATVTFAGRDFPGTVERTSGSIDKSTRTLRVEVVVPNPEHALLPGVHVQVALQQARNQPQLQIPASALLFRSKGPAVAAIAPGGKVNYKDVHITRDSGDVVEVDGLSPNETVALNISNAVMDGDVVKTNDLDKENANGEKTGSHESKPKTIAVTAPPTTRVSDASQPQTVNPPAH
jgi:RND family efflux transporter MFP subunit